MSDKRGTPTLLGRGLAYLWAGPASIFGLIVAALAQAGGAFSRVEAGVLEVCGGKVLPFLLSLLDNGAPIEALTLGHVVVARTTAAMEANRLHERVHVRQYEQWGLLFIPLYLGASAIAMASGKDPYLDNPFEKAAFEAAANAPEPFAGAALDSMD